MSGLGYRVARTVAEALSLKASLGPEARWLAGGTAMQLGWAEGVPDRPLIDIGTVNCGPAVSLGADGLRLSATATLETMRRDPLLVEHLPVLATALASIAAFGVRHLATLGGNVMWGAGDLVPLLLVLNADLETADHGVVPLARRADHLDMFVTGVSIALPTGPVMFEKVGRRAAFSPSLVTVAAACAAEGIRCAVGGGPVPPQLAVFAAIPDAAALACHFEAPDDAFASGLHRRQVAARVLEGHMAAFARNRRA